ncbi:LPS translocon maturation chaperone LptM [Kordiimonas pumila]|uniref:Lipoprotein n=1 Tax=Kordiimonas pumila TaxID=2161677 RepID=A0ABV7D050_9PROT|nr:lipoprotein [Kordiimonas pumila]
MKKLFLALLIAATTFSVSACGKKGDVNPPPSQTTE